MNKELPVDFLAGVLNSCSPSIAPGLGGSPPGAEQRHAKAWQPLSEERKKGLRSPGEPGAWPRRRRAASLTPGPFNG